MSYRLAVLVLLGSLLSGCTFGPGFQWSFADRFSVDIGGPVPICLNCFEEDPEDDDVDVDVEP